MAGNASLDSVAPLPGHRQRRRRVGRGLLWRGNYWHALSSLGVRPVSTFDSCLLVSWQDEESQGTTGEEAQKEKRWDAYIEYLNDWADDHSGTECYGAAPLGFDEWLEEEYDWSKEDEGDDE